MGTVSAHNSLMSPRTSALSYCFYGARSRNRTGKTFRPRDFKSLVSTNFTIRAEVKSITCSALIFNRFAV